MEGWCCLVKVCYVKSEPSCLAGLSEHVFVVRDSNLGHQLLLPPANWCPKFASRTTHR